jgi:hypothetical protein
MHPEPIQIAGGSSDPVLDLVEESTDTGGLFTNEAFQERVTVVMEAIKDEEKHRRCVAEIHTYLSMFDEGMRMMQAEIASGGGPFAMMKKLMGR